MKPKMTHIKRTKIESDQVVPSMFHKQGWHFCADWDFMLVGPVDPEWECCTCEARKVIDGDAA